MALSDTIEGRLAAVEERVADIEGGHGESIYRLERRGVRTERGVMRILAHLGLEPVTDEPVTDEPVDTVRDRS